MTMISFGKAAATSLVFVAMTAATPAAAQGRRTQAMIAPPEMGPPPMQSLGGPIRQGSYCWITTDNRGLGYWRLCGTGYESFAATGARGHPLSAPIPQTDPYAAAREADANLYPGGGGGGGGGDSGGGATP
jgi:hypothetical protein